MKISKMQTLSLTFGLIFVFLISGIYLSNLDNNQTAQLIKASQQRANNQIVNPISNLTSSSAIQSNPAWRMLRVGNDFMVKVPDQSLPAIATFCQDLATVLPPGADLSKRGAARGDNGKFYCNDNGVICGDGTRDGCRRSGCCGGCLNGIYPPGVTDPADLPNVVFIPDTIIRAIRNNVNQ